MCTRTSRYPLLGTERVPNELMFLPGSGTVLGTDPVLATVSVEDRGSNMLGC